MIPDKRKNAHKITDEIHIFPRVYLEPHHH